MKKKVSLGAFGFILAGLDVAYFETVAKYTTDIIAIAGIAVPWFVGLVSILLVGVQWYSSDLQKRVDEQVEEEG